MQYKSCKLKRELSTAVSEMLAGDSMVCDILLCVGSEVKETRALKVLPSPLYLLDDWDQFRSAAMGQQRVTIDTSSKGGKVEVLAIIGCIEVGPSVLLP